MYGTHRTGVRFVLTNPTDPSRVDEFGAWYDRYGAALTRPGALANAYRFDNPRAAGNEQDPRFAAIYDIVTADPATAWPDTEASPDYPRALFDDPRSTLISPVSRASYALVGSQQTPGEHGELTGIHALLTGGADDMSRHQWAAQILQSGLFYAASRYRLIEGFPEPAPWLEIFETDQPDPLDAFPRAVEMLAPHGPDPAIHRNYAGSFQLVSMHPQPTNPPPLKASGKIQNIPAHQ